MQLKFWKINFSYASLLSLCLKHNVKCLERNEAANRPYVFMSAFYFNVFNLHRSASPPEKPGLVIMYHQTNYIIIQQNIQLTIMLRKKSPLRLSASRRKSTSPEGEANGRIISAPTGVGNMSGSPRTHIFRQTRRGRLRPEPRSGCVAPWYSDYTNKRGRKSLTFAGMALDVPARPI